MITNNEDEYNYYYQFSSSSSSIIGCILLILIYCITMWKSIIQSYMEEKRPFHNSDIPMARGSHWFYGHAYLFRKYNKQQKQKQYTSNNNDSNKDKEKKSSYSYDIDFRDIQRILSIDSSNRYGHCSFWIYQHSYISLYHWQDIATIKRILFNNNGSRNEHDNNNITRNDDSLEYNNISLWNSSNVANIFPLLYNRFNKRTIKEKCNAIYLYRFEFTNFCSNDKAIHLMKSIIEKTMSLKVHMIKTKMNREKEKCIIKKATTMNPIDHQSTKLKSDITFQVDCTILIRKILWEVWCQFFFSCSIDNDIIISSWNSTKQHHKDNEIKGIVDVLKEIFEYLKKIRNMTNHKYQNTELNERLIHQFVNKQIHNRLQYDTIPILKSNNVSITTEENITYDALDSLLKYSKVLDNNQQQQIKGEKRKRNISSKLLYLSDYVSHFLLKTIDMSTSILSYALYAVSQIPIVEKACLNEIENATIDNNINILDVNQLLYCNAIILETLRLFPPKVSIVRKTSSCSSVVPNVTLHGGNITLPTNENTTSIYLPIWSIHRLKCNFPRPEEFRPDRWVYEQNNQSLDHSTATNGHHDNHRIDDDDSFNDDSYYNKWKERPLTDNTSDIPAANRKAFISSFSTLSGGDNTPIDQILLINCTLIFATLLKTFQFEMINEYALTPELFNNDIQFPKGGMPLQINLRRS